MQRRNNLQPRPHGPLRIVFMGDWIPEVDQQAVTQVLGNMPIVPTDHFGAGRLIRTHHLPQLFRVELRGERGRAHEVTEHHCQLATFRLGWVLGVGGWGLATDN